MLRSYFPLSDIFVPEPNDRAEINVTRWNGFNSSPQQQRASVFRCIFDRFPTRHCCVPLDDWQRQDTLLFQPRRSTHEARAAAIRSRTDISVTDEVIPDFQNHLGVPVIEIGAKKFMWSARCDRTIHMSIATWATTSSMSAPIARRSSDTTPRWRLTKRGRRNANSTTSSSDWIDRSDRARRGRALPFPHFSGGSKLRSSCLAASERNSSRCSNLRLRGF